MHVKRLTMARRQLQTRSQLNPQGNHSIINNICIELYFSTIEDICSVFRILYLEPLNTKLLSKLTVDV